MTESNPVFDVDDLEHQAFREEAWRLYEAWLNQHVDLSEVDLTGEAWTTTNASFSGCSPRNAEPLSSL